MKTFNVKCPTCGEAVEINVKDETKFLEVLCSCGHNTKHDLYAAEAPTEAPAPEVKVVMSFGKALEEVKSGKEVRRNGWGLSNLILRGNDLFIHGEDGPDKAWQHKWQPRMIDFVMNDWETI